MYNEDELIEIVKAVESIQFDVFDSTDGVEYYNISVETNGFSVMVNFLGICVWDSEIDLRKYDEDNDTYEPIEQCLRRNINDELKKINSIAV